MRDGGNDVIGAETGDEQDRADHRIHDDIADDERRKQILVGLLPRDRFVTGIAFNAGGDLA